MNDLDIASTLPFAEKSCYMKGAHLQVIFI